MDWWMHHANECHTGEAAGPSRITSGTVDRLGLVGGRPIVVDDVIVAIPTIVGGKIYVGTGGSLTPGGTLYKIDLGTGAVEATFPVTGRRTRTGFQGVSSAAAVVDGRVYFSVAPGILYCVTADPEGGTGLLREVWHLDFNTIDLAKRHPIQNQGADLWSSPLVVNGRVYVGVGEGEEQEPRSFVYCLDALTGQVIWVFNTNQVDPLVDNRPNVLPRSSVPDGVLVPTWPFTLGDDPESHGASPWSSCAYSVALDRIYIGTGNDYPDTPLPNHRYASGVISLDATTGAFRGFFQPLKSDSYRPDTDQDLDVPAAPMLFERDGTWVVAIGSKNGSFFLLDADGLGVLARRQLLPYDEVTGARPSYVDPIGGTNENMWGVHATAAVHRGLGRLFVGLGGRDGVGDPGAEQVVPFIRALDWTTLKDAWPTCVESVGGFKIRRYVNGRPPLYRSRREAGVSAPAVVNDLVFMTTSLTGLYAFSADTGDRLWAADGMPAGGFPTYCVGPAIVGDSVVVGVGNQVRIYRLPDDDDGPEDDRRG
jgi:outer membrane protein assembly factor BamB